MNGTDIGQFMLDLLASLTASVFAENIVFARAIGSATLSIAAKNKRSLPGVCLGVTYMTTITALVTGLCSAKLLTVNAAYIPLAYIIIVSFVYILTLLLARIIFGTAFGRIKKYVHVSAFNATVVGTMFLSLHGCSRLSEYVIFGLGTGIGFTAAAYMLSAVRAQLYSESTPKAFRGYPAVMIFVGIMAMAFYGVLGHAPSYI